MDITPEVSPAINIDDDATPLQRQLLENLRSGIEQHPEVYEAALKVWVTAKEKSEGQAIVEATHYLTEASTAVSSELFGKAYDEWISYMSSLADRAFSFDIGTETALRTHEPILKIQSNKELTPEEQTQQVRIKRMQVYLGRVVANKHVLQARDELQRPA